MRRIKIFVRIISIVMALMLGTSALADEELVESLSTSSPEPVSVQIQETVNENIAPVVETVAEEKKSSIPDTVSKDSVSEIVNEDTKSLVAQNSDLVEELIEEKQESIEENSVESETDYLTLPENIENSEESIPEVLSVLDKNDSTQNEAPSSLYTVDFTNNGTTYSIAGDSKKVKLSTILNNINIAGDISDVKVFMDEDCTEDAENGLVAVDGKPLFNVYKDDDGEWYVDSTNAFSSIHGLKVFLPDNKEYKIKVTDAQVIKYLDENGVEQTLSETYTEITNSFGSTTSATTLNAGWYVVTGNNVSTKSLIVNGLVKIILLDNSSLTVNAISTNAAVQVENGKTLIVYGQSDSANMGKLIANGNTSSGAGIGGSAGKSSGDITINGGCISAVGQVGGAAIGGGSGSQSGTITINGGKITATSKSTGAGIGGGAVASSGSIIINGGTVTASSTLSGAGIGGGGAAVSNDAGDGTVTINGGIIVATGGKGESINAGPMGTWEYGAGAGIGGGGYCNNSYGGIGNIVINNGDVTAIAGQNPHGGSKYAYGIGTGARWGTKSTSSSITVVSKEIYVGESSTNNTKTSFYSSSGNPQEKQYVHILKTTLKPYVPPVSPISGNSDSEEDEVFKKVIVRSIEYSELSAKQKDSVENLKKNGKGMINYLEASLFGMTYGNANQGIIIDGSFFTGHSPSEINLWHISTNGAMKEVEFSANNGSIIIASHNALLGNYVITD